MSAKRTTAKGALILGTILGFGTALYEANAVYEAAKTQAKEKDPAKIIDLADEIIAGLGKEPGAGLAGFLCVSALTKMERPTYQNRNEFDHLP